MVRIRNLNLGAVALFAICFALFALSAQALTLTGVQSRKTHQSGVGVLDLPIDTTQPMSGSVTVEPRGISAAGHMIVFQFDGPVTSTGTLSVIDDTAAVLAGSTATASDNEVIVSLGMFTDNKRVEIQLANVNGSFSTPPISIGFLVGDLNASGAINSSDISAVKARSGLTLP